MVSRSSVGTLLLAASWCAPGAALAEDAGEPFGDLPLVDEVIVGSNEDDHAFTESPPAASEVQQILGKATRVLLNEGGPRYFAYKLGEGRGLTAGRAYVLALEYPEDAPRTVYVINRGAEMNRGFATGSALGDVVRTYTAQNLESLSYPLSGRSEWWRTFFHLHDRFGDLAVARNGDPRPGRPEDGFWVIIAQPGEWQIQSGNTKQAPESAGAAVSRIQLFEVPDPETFYPPVPYPEGDLPRRHLFWREEIADGVVQVADSNTLGVEPTVNWYRYKAELMRFLGMNTFSKDLLEFGHNQGWDSNYKEYGGQRWYWNSSEPERWANILDMLADYDHYVLPYYEYNGSRGQAGLGDERRCRPLARDDAYTHITWSESACVDVSDPDFEQDAKALLDTTLLQHADRAHFIGAWFRTRVSHVPISFADATLARFAEATGRAAVTRAELLADEALLQNYYSWWFGQRQRFLTELRDYLQSESGDPLKLFYTAYNEEGGPNLDVSVVSDRPEFWAGLGFDEPLAWQSVIAEHRYAERLTAFPATWGDWEWQHSLPPPDPQNYSDVEDILFTHPYNRLYTVSDPQSFDTMRTPGGLAIVYHYSLNENVMTTSAGDELVGYFVTDVERAGPYVTLPEARALAYGDPRYIGYLSGHSFNRGFPNYVRNFNLAFLALPAVPSQIASDATDHESVIVRHYPTALGTDYYAVINVGLESARDVTLTLPEGRLVDAVTGAELTRSADALTLDLYPGQVRALKRVASEDPGGPSGGAGGASGGAGAGGTSTSGGQGGTSGMPTPGPDDAAEEGGCSCRTTGTATTTSGWLAVGALGACFVRSRRHRRTRRARS